MTEQMTQIGFTRLVAAHLTRMPALKRVTPRTDEALLCETKTGQTFLVLVTGPGVKTENGRQPEAVEEKVVENVTPKPSRKAA